MITLWRGRDCDFTVTIMESDGSAYSYVASDVIRIKVGREGSVPILDLSSKAASANSSTVSAANPCALLLRAADVDLLARGFYEFEISVVDDSDSDRIKHVQSHVVLVQETQKGSVSV